MKKNRNPKGVIALITMLILAGVGILAMAMVAGTQLNSTAANNYRYKLQTYCAADGITTLLSQDVLDFNENKYLTGISLDHCNIGTSGDPSKTGNYIHNATAGADTVIGDGTDIYGSVDHFHYAYCKMSGDMQLSVKVNSVSAANEWSKAGLMIRQDTVNNNRFVYVVITPSHGLEASYRPASGANSVQGCNNTGFTCPIWLRLTRSGNAFQADRSSDGSTWTNIWSGSVTMTDPVLAGLAVTSHAKGTLCTGAFSNLAGLAGKTGSGAANVGDNLIPVNYSITQTGTNTFSMSAESYIESGPSKIHNYTVRLNQGLSRKAAGKWLSAATDVASIPVTLYDMRSDMSNPEFDINASLVKGGYHIARIIRTDALTSDRKPIKKNLHNTDSLFRQKFISLWDPNWYTTSTAQRCTHTSAVSVDALLSVGIPLPDTFPWSFCDSIHTWFRPWGDSAGKTGTYTFDPYSGIWSGLKMRPGWTPQYTGEDTEWVAQHWDSTYKFANIVMYDTLIFNEKGSAGSGIFRFGDTVFNPKWFFNYKPSSGCTIDKVRFMPLMRRGFGFDCGVCPYSVDACDPAAWKTQNYSYTMEIHRVFTYKSGQTFSFTGDDDVWVFINNKCVIDLGGVHIALSRSVNLDTCHLTEGQQYPFDFFYDDREVTECNILITTNMNIFVPPQPLKRSWKRDYGNLD